MSDPFKSSYQDPFGFSPYHTRSLSVSTAWATGSDTEFPRPTTTLGSPRFRTRSPAQLAGAHFPNGTVYDPTTSAYNHLREAQAITRSARRTGGTLHEHHVNLESGVGQHLKRSMGLPFQEHSRVDPQAAAGQAAQDFAAIFQSARERADLKVPLEVAHPLADYQASLETLGYRVKGALGWGAESLALELDGDRVLKITQDSLENGWGSRPFDLPVLDRGQINVTRNGRTRRISYMVQPKVTPGGTPEELRLLRNEIEGLGYSWEDSGARQMAIHGGRPVLLDPFSAINRGGPGTLAVRQGTPGLRALPEMKLGAVTVEAAVHQVAQEVIPTAEAAAQVAQQITGGVERGTVNALHRNLESRTGQILKRLLRLPFKAHSRVDPGAAAGHANEVFQNIRVVRGSDPQGAFAEVNPTGLAQREIWAHGETGMGGQWTLHMGGAARNTADLVRDAAQAQEVESVLIRACNLQHHHVLPHPSQRLIYGFGDAFNAPYGGPASPPGLSGAVAWTDAVVIAEGDLAQVYEKAALAEWMKVHRPEAFAAAGDLTQISLFQRGGETRLGLGGFTKNPAELTRSSVLLSEAPFRTLGGTGASPTAAAARQVVQEAAEEVTERGFRSLLGLDPKVVKGGLVAGGLVLGLLAMNGVTRKPKAHANPHVDGRSDEAGPSHRSESAQTGTPTGRTRIQISDHPLNMTEVDSAFSNHYRTGYAYTT